MPRLMLGGFACEGGLPPVVGPSKPSAPSASPAHMGPSAKGADTLGAYFFLFAAALAFVACCEVMSACFF